MTRKLRPYQIVARNKIRENPACALYMEMRLGKTLATISGLLGYSPILVVAPMVGLWAWKRELALEGLESRMQVLVGSKKDRLEMLKVNKVWNLINYEGILSVPEILEKDWEAVVLDECRRISNPKAKTTKLLVNWSRRNFGIKKVILSGNPAPESPLEYFEQMRFLYGKFMRCDNYWMFRNYYFRELGPHNWVPKPTAIVQIKQEVHANAYVLTRKQAGLKDTKVYETRTVRLGHEARRTYEKIRSEFLMSWRGRELKTTKWVPVQYLWLQQISSGFIGGNLVDRCKVTETLELLKGELRDEQVVVWFRFNSGIRAVHEVLRKAGISHSILQGNVVPSDREKAIDAFRSGRCRILLCQIKVAKEAIDLSCSSTAIYFTNSHSLDERMQSEDRILNPAKKDPLLYIDLVTEDTVDEDIVEALRDKKVESRFFLSRLLEKLQSGR